MRISPRDRLIITAVALLLVIVAVAVAGIYPQVQQTAAIEKQIQSANNDVQQNKALLEQRQAAKDRAAQTDAATLRLANAVPENPELPALIIELQDAALAAGVQFDSLSPAEPIQGPSGSTAAISPGGSGFVTLPVALQVTGTWSDTIDFMRRLNSMTRAVRTVSFSSVLKAAPASESPTATPPPPQEATALALEVYVIPSSATAAPAQ